MKSAGAMILLAMVKQGVGVPVEITQPPEAVQIAQLKAQLEHMSTIMLGRGASGADGGGASGVVTSVGTSPIKPPSMMKSSAKPSMQVMRPSSREPLQQIRPSSRDRGV